MSYEPRVHIEDNIHNKSVVAYHRRDAQFGTAARYTSSVVVNIRQLQIDLSTQHQHDKEALSELNQRFQLFVDRVHVLQSQNSKLTAAIADIRRRFTGFSSADLHLEESYLALNPELTAARIDRVDMHWNIELFHLQAAIYQQLIEIEHKWVGKRSSVLEDELKHSASVLVSLRASYGELQREVESLYVEGNNLFKRYLALSHEWCHAKKQRSKWELGIDSLKNAVIFYKKIRSHSHVDMGVSIQTEDVSQFYALELERLKKRIRIDFEKFYTASYHEMSASYEAKMIEMQTNVQAALTHHVAVEETSTVYLSQQVEYEKVQKSLMYERESYTQLQHSYSKLESDYKAIQIQYEERFEQQSSEMYNLQEHIMSMVFDVDELRRSKVNLEAEIIVYRLLLESIGLERRVVVSSPEVSGSEGTGRIAVRKQKKKSIGIHECAPNGSFISIVNYSTNNDIDLSKWIIKRHIDSTSTLRYTIPDGVRLKHGGELRIYSTGGANSIVDSSSYKILVNDEIVSWGLGNTIETLLFNSNGDEEASYSQRISF